MAPRPPNSSAKPRVLFVCVENACRSQMAAGFARALAGARAEIWSAGSRPAPEVDRRAVAFMRERGIDLTALCPQGLNTLPAGPWDAIVTMGCGDACPHLPARRRIAWDLPDPKTLDDAGFRAVRDEIERRVRDLLESLP